MKKNYVDIDYFTKEYDLKYASNNHSLLAENKELFDEIIQSKSVFNQFKKVEKYLNCIYLTDRKIISKEDNILYFSFKNEIGNEQLYKEITHFVHLFYDQLCIYKISQNYVKEALTRRTEFEKFKIKEKLKQNIKNPDHKISTKRKGK